LGGPLGRCLGARRRRREAARLRCCAGQALRAKRLAFQRGDRCVDDCVHMFFVFLLRPIPMIAGDV